MLFPAFCLLGAGALRATALQIDALAQRDGDQSHVMTLDNANDLRYRANITLNGEKFEVLIDTGSSDLWVAGTVNGAKDTGKDASVAYAIGAAGGPVKTAKAEFLGYTIEDQAFIAQAPTVQNPNGQGIVGLGPNAVSQVHAAMGNGAGDAIVDRIFRQNTSSPNYITALLGRSDDPDHPFPGSFSVGEIIAGYENVTNQPKLNVTSVTKGNSGNQHWQVLIDPDGIIGPDGQPISSADSKVSSTKDKNQLTAIFDTGYSLPQVPKSIADNIYGRFEKAEFKNESAAGIGAVWTLPCDTEVNITVRLGGLSYPMHPHDTNLDLGLKNSDGDDMCIGSFQPITGASTSTYDVILGMAFLRNAYLLINYGDFRDGTTNKDDPYVQLLSTTDPAEAHEDFVQTRLDGVDTTGDQRLLNSSQIKTSDDPTPDDNSDNSSGGIGAWFSKHYVVVAVAGGSAVAALLLLALLCYWLRARKQKRAIRAGFARGGGGGYATLDAPAPEHETLQVAGYNAVVPTLGYGGASPSPAPSPRPGHRPLLSGTEAARTHRPSSSFSGSQDFSAVARSAGESGHKPMDSLSVDPLYAMPPGYKRDAKAPYSHSRGESEVSLVWSGDGDSEHGGEQPYHEHEDDDKTPLNRTYPNPWDARH